MARFFVMSVDLLLFSMVIVHGQQHQKQPHVVLTKRFLSSLPAMIYSHLEGDTNTTGQVMSHILGDGILGRMINPLRKAIGFDPRPENVNQEYKPADLNRVMQSHTYPPLLRPSMKSRYQHQNYVSSNVPSDFYPNGNQLSGTFGSPNVRGTLVQNESIYQKRKYEQRLEPTIDREMVAKQVISQFKRDIRQVKGKLSSTDSNRMIVLSDQTPIQGLTLHDRRRLEALMADLKSRKQRRNEPENNHSVQTLFGPPARILRARQNVARLNPGQVLALNQFLLNYNNDKRQSETTPVFKLNYPKVANICDCIRVDLYKMQGDWVHALGNSDNVRDIYQGVMKMMGIHDNSRWDPTCTKFRFVNVTEMGNSQAIQMIWSFQTTDWSKPYKHVLKGNVETTDQSTLSLDVQGRGSYRFSLPCTSEQSSDQTNTYYFRNDQCNSTHVLVRNPSAFFNEQNEELIHFLKKQLTSSKMKPLNWIPFGKNCD